MAGISLPLAEEDYFPGGGNAVSFMTPAGIEGIAARMAYSGASGLFSMFWDEARTTEVPAGLAKAMCELTTPIWPHTFIVPKYASMVEYKQYPPANHFHITWDLPVARLQHWMDLTGVLSVTPWAARPKFIEGVDRPQPLLHLISGGEDTCKLLRAARTLGTS
jgi:L-fucose isomerase